MYLTELAPEDLDPAQEAAVAEAVAGIRGRVPGPMRAWLHSPVLASRAQSLGAFLRYETTLSAAVSELAILLTARHVRSNYVWNAHVPGALAGGLDRNCIDALAVGRDPGFDNPQLRVAHDYVTTLLSTSHVPIALHRTSVEMFGEIGVVELVGIAGYYTLAALTVNAFAFELKPGAKPVFD